MEISRQFVGTVKDQLTRKGISVRAAALELGVPVRSLYGVLSDGQVPTINRAAEICRALGLEFYIGPPRDGSAATPAASIPEPVNRFNPDMDMLTRGYAKCSTVGHLEKESEHREIPAPEGIRDIDADSFYAIAKGPSMGPDGIEEGDYCLVSPNTPLVVGMRVWLKDRQGRACIKRLTDEDEQTYALRGWRAPGPPERQRSYDDKWTKSDIAEKGVVLAVWRGKPDVANPPELIPDPKAPTAEAVPAGIAEALGLPPGGSVEDAVKALEERLKGAGGFDAEALRDEMAGVVKAQTESLREDMAARLEEARGDMTAVREDIAGLADARALANSPVGADEPPGARPIDVVELAAAAGGGAEALSEDVAGRVWFRRDWLAEHALDPARCAVIGVAGESMEPTLPDGCSILIDRNRTERRGGGLFVVHTPDEGLVVKRLASGRKSGWLLASDHPAWEDIPLPRDAEIIGRVVWTARTLLGEER